MSGPLPSLSVVIIYDIASGKDRVDVNSVVEGVANIHATLEDLGHRVLQVCVSDGVLPFIHALEAAKPDVVFNLCEGYRETSAGEYCIAGVLELLGLPYTGSGPLALALALDKPMAKRLFISAGIATPAFAVYTPGAEVAAPLSYPRILKLAGEHASLGMTRDNVVADEPSLVKRLNELFAAHQAAVLAEEFIDGREFMVALLGGQPIGLEEIEFTFEPRIVCYRTKWDAESAEYRGVRAVFAPHVTDEQRAAMFELAKHVCDVVGVRDYARVDFRMSTAGQIYVLEVNPNPDITPGSGYRRSLGAAGISFAAFVGRLVSNAFERRRLGGSDLTVLRAQSRFVE